MKNLIKKILKESFEEWGFVNYGDDWVQVNSDNVYVGMRVIIDPESEFHYQAPHIWGKIVDKPHRFGGDLWVNVYFDNGIGNTFIIGPKQFDLLTEKDQLIKESDFDWVKSIPSNYDLGLYNFLNKNFKVTERDYTERDYTGGLLGQLPYEFIITVKYLIGLDEVFNMISQSKKEILNKIYWLVVDEFPNLDEGLIRKTIRVFLNEKYN